jgi:hypothetical protein
VQTPLAGKNHEVEADVVLESVETHTTRSGNTRYVVRDDRGGEYTTFREEIGKAAKQLEGKRARIEFHEQQRGQFTNVYLDAVGESASAPAGEEDTDVEEVAWKTAVDAAPWLLGSQKGEGEVPPDELFEKLEPFKRLVSEDIREGGEEDDPETGSRPEP